MSINNELICNVKHTSIQASAACNTVCIIKFTIFFIAKISCITFSTFRLILTSFSVFASSARINWFIWDRLLIMFICSIEFFESKILWLEFFSSSSYDRISSYASINFEFICLNSSYALFQIFSSAFDEDNELSERSHWVMIVAEIRESEEVKKDKILKEEDAELVEIADDYQKYQQRLLFWSDRTNICLKDCVDWKNIYDLCFKLCQWIEWTSRFAR